MSSTTDIAVKDDGGGFFDDDHNKAMYLVLPAMILIYGGCSLIYCVHKCRRYCLTQKKKKLKAKTRRKRIEESHAFHNAALVIHDGHRDSNRGARGPRPQSNELVLEHLDLDKENPKLMGAKFSKRVQETNVDSLDDALKTDKLEGVAPGYSSANGYNTGNLNQEMQNLDNQLKVAFRLVNPTAGKQVPNTRTSLPMDDKSLAAYATWKTLQRTDIPKLTVRSTPAGDTVVERIPAYKRKSMLEQGGVEISEEDIQRIAEVRKTLAKDMPKSMPDIFRRPDENEATLKKISSGNKKHIFFSQQ